MKWTVTYSPAAQNELAEIWLYTADKSRVARAADDIDRLLRTNPLGVGESRSDDSRVLVYPPIAVQYDVYVDDCRVTVVAVRHGRRDRD
jgi:plasmid stabilization system protein ParE